MRNHTVLNRVIGATMVFFAAPAVMTAQTRLQRACTASDAVVVGSIKSAYIPLLRGNSLLNLSVERVIKGQVVPGATISVTWKGDPVSARVTPDPYRGIWFLQQSGTEGWDVVPVGGPHAPLVASGLAVPPGNPIRENGALPGCYEALWAELRESIGHFSESFAYRSAIETLMLEGPGQVPAIPAAAVTFQELAKSSSLDLRALGLAFGLYQRDPEALVQVAEQIEEIARSQEAVHVALAIFSWRNPDTRAVDALGRISRAKVKGFSDEVAEALMAIHSRDAVPHLAGLLSSNDRSAQIKAVRGLSLFVQDVPVMTVERVQRMEYLIPGQSRKFLSADIEPYIAVTGVPSDREAEYIAAWKRWWESTRDGWN